VEKNLMQRARIEKEISDGARSRTMREDRLLSRDRLRWLPERIRAFGNFFRQRLFEAKFDALARKKYHARDRFFIER
jgi:hypothetical protein